MSIIGDAITVPPVNRMELIDLSSAVVAARYNATASISSTGTKAIINTKFTTASGHEGVAVTIPCEANSIYLLRYKNTKSGGAYSDSYRYGLYLTNTPITSAGSTTFNLTPQQDWARNTSGTDAYLYAYWTTRQNTAFSFCIIANGLTSSQTLDIELEIGKPDFGFSF